MQEQETADTLEGLKNGEYGDVVRLHLKLQAPVNAKCFALDFAFYTVDLPAGGDPANVCASSNADSFTAHVNDPTFSPDGNIARNGHDQEVTAATMSPGAIYAALNSADGINTPGAFPLLQMRHIVTGGAPIDLYLAIQDRGDPLGASAVALDNFRWITGTDSAACSPNPDNTGDRDGDGLPDGWEEFGTYGRSTDGKLQALDLPAWGADPDVKDVFVEIDSMRPITYDPRPEPDAIAMIVEAFANAPVDAITSATAGDRIDYKGVRLHVDYGPTAPLTTTSGQSNPSLLWAGASRGSLLPDSPDPDLCGGQCGNNLRPLWKRFNEIKQANFALERAGVFHYALFAHSLAVCTTLPCHNVEKISGISRNYDDTGYGASDFVVSLGAPQWWSATNAAVTSHTLKVDSQAGTFMHELGHNLGLNHYGLSQVNDPVHAQERVLRKPNHLSVMNYLYQTNGLVTTDPSFRFDYLRYNMKALDEHLLTETEGLYWAQSGVAITYTLGVGHFCPSRMYSVTVDATQVDWNCNKRIGDVRDVNITGDLTVTHPGDHFPNKRVLSSLVVDREWDQLLFTGGLLNRQRSILYPFILERNLACPPSPAQPTPPGPLAPETFTRRLITPRPIDLTVLDRQVQEELTPILNQQILQQRVPYLNFRPAHPQLNNENLRRLVENLRTRLPVLPEPVDIFINQLLTQ